MKRIFAIGALLALVVAVSADAASSPATGDWHGQFKGSFSKVGLGFTVAKSGGSKRVVNLASVGALKPPCVGALSTTVADIPPAKISSNGTFKGFTSLNDGFGNETWTVKGKFTSSHAASGTVAIVLYPTTKPCKFTAAWSAKLEPSAPPVRGGHYKGKTGNDQAGGGAAVTFEISHNGKKITSITWTPPAIFTTCPGNNGSPPVTGHNVPIHHGKFTLTLANGTVKHGVGTRITNTIEGQFLSGHDAAGTISTGADIAGQHACKGNNTWTAHA